MVKEAEVRNEVLWNNKFITVNNSPIFWKSWKEAGIVRVEDILIDGSFMSDTQISQRYGVQCNFLQALQIRHSIPGSWRASLSNGEVQTPEECVWIINNTPDIVNLFSTSSRELYWIVLYRYSQMVTKNEQKWGRTYPNIPFTDATWRDTYMCPYKVNRETKLQSFQYKVLHRIIACNKYLLISVQKIAQNVCIVMGQSTP